jgi:uncharacterized protein (TIGR00251 family)
MFTELYPFKQTSDGIYLNIKVTPKASQNKIGKVIASEEITQLKIYVTDPPQDGKANDAIIALLARELGIGKSLITIIKGHNQRNKVCLINNTEPQTILTLRSISF